MPGGAVGERGKASTGSWGGGRAAGRPFCRQEWRHWRQPGSRMGPPVTPCPPVSRVSASPSPPYPGGRCEDAGVEFERCQEPGLDGTPVVPPPPRSSTAVFEGGGCGWAGEPHSCTHPLCPPLPICWRAAEPRPFASPSAQPSARSWSQIKGATRPPPPPVPAALAGATASLAASPRWGSGGTSVRRCVRLSCSHQPHPSRCATSRPALLSPKQAVWGVPVGSAPRTPHPLHPTAPPEPTASPGTPTGNTSVTPGERHRAHVSVGKGDTSPHRRYLTAGMAPG